MEDIYPHFISIDFGTSNTAAAYWDTETNAAKSFRFSDSETYKLPSVVFYEDENHIVGQVAVEELLDAYKYSDERKMEIQSRIITGIKKDIRPNYCIAVNGQILTPEDIISDILKHVKRDIENKALYGQLVNKVILAHPVSFSGYQENVLINAARNAGFEEIKLIKEPEAAAYGHLSCSQISANNIMVFDLGGGTFDLSVLARQEDGTYQVSLPSKGNSTCGGDFIDIDLFKYLDKKCQEKFKFPLSKENEIKSFLTVVQRFKESSSIRFNNNYTSTKFSHRLLEPINDFFEEEITQSIFDAVLLPRIDIALGLTQEMLEEAKKQNINIDHVVLVGGSSKLPIVKNKLSEVLLVKPMETIETDTLVALGAAVWANNSRPSPLLSDCSEDSVIENFMELSQKEFNEENYSKALIHVEKACFYRPGYIPALLLRTSILSKLGEYNEAIFTTDRIININNKNEEAYLIRCLAKIEIEDFTSALSDIVIHLDLLNNKYDGKWDKLPKEYIEEVFEAYLLKVELELVKNEDFFQSRKTLEDLMANKNLFDSLSQPQIIAVYCLLSHLTFVAGEFDVCTGHISRTMLLMNQYGRFGLIKEICERFELNDKIPPLGNGSLRCEVQNLLLNCSQELFSGLNYEAIRHFIANNQFEEIEPEIWNNNPEFGLLFTKFLIENSDDISLKYLEQYYKITQNENLAYVKDTISYYSANRNNKKRLDDFFSIKLEIRCSTGLMNDMRVINKSNIPVTNIKVYFSYYRTDKKCKLKGTFEHNEKITKDDSAYKNGVFERKGIWSGISNVDISKVNCSQGQVHYTLDWVDK